VKGNVAALEYGAHLDRELLAAPATLPYARANVRLASPLWSKPVSFVHKAAVGADRAVRPEGLFEELGGLNFGAEFLD